MLLSYDPFENIDKDHNWKKLYKGKSDDGLLDFEYLLCSNCNMSAICRDSLCYGYNHIFPDYAFKCHDFTKYWELSITHDWKLDFNVALSMRDKAIFDYSCSLCGIEGMKLNWAATPWIVLKNLYTCNEWLMLRANE